jgi:hypothetical protein
LPSIVPGWLTTRPTGVYPSTPNFGCNPKALGYEDPQGSSGSVVRQLMYLLDLLRVYMNNRTGKAAELCDTGCDTTSKLRLTRYHQTLEAGPKRGLKYLKHIQYPVPREEVGLIAVRCSFVYSGWGLEANGLRRIFANCSSQRVGAKF